MKVSISKTQVGDKFEIAYTTPFGKTGTTIETVVAINNRNFLMTNGQTYYNLQ